jgi:hypothetical protein
MLENENVQLNEGDGLSPEDAALFQAAIGPEPEKPKRGKKAKKEGEKPTVSKFASKHLAEEAAGVTQVETPAVTVEPKAPEAPSVDLFEGLVADIMGEDNNDWERMIACRKEAYDLLRRMRDMNMPELERRAKWDAHDISTFWTWDSQKKMYNGLRKIFEERAEGKSSAEKEAIAKEYDVVRLRFEAHQDALKIDPESPVAQAFMARVLKHVEAVGNMEKHLANQEKARAILAAFDEKKAEHEELHKQAVALFEEANVIAIVHDWPLTGKDKDKEANGNKKE